MVKIEHGFRWFLVGCQNFLFIPSHSFLLVGRSSSPKTNNDGTNINVQHNPIEGMKPWHPEIETETERLRLSQRSEICPLLMLRERRNRPRSRHPWLVPSYPPTQPNSKNNIQKHPRCESAQGVVRNRSTSTNCHRLAFRNVARVVKRLPRDNVGSARSITRRDLAIITNTTTKTVFRRVSSPCCVSKQLV